MGRQPVLVMASMIVIVGMLGVAFKVQKVKAGGTIYIRADGSVAPSDAPISSVDNVTYTFTDNVNDSVVVERDNIVVDGAGYTVQGNGADFGISLECRKNVTISNLNIKGFHYCIRFFASFNNKICGNNITNNVNALCLYGSSHNNISGNNIAENTYWGVLLSASSENVFRSNNMTNNGRAFFISPQGFWDFINDIDSSNTIDGKTVYYWINKQDSIVPVDAGFVALLDCSNITVENLTLTRNGHGILLGHTHNCTIRRNNVTNNTFGIHLYRYSSNNSIYRNNITENEWSVLLDHHADHNRLFYNNFVNNDVQADSRSSFNSWDNGLEGNYWSDYAGIDSNNDGIGDTPYTVDTQLVDRYPLMAQYNTLTQCNTFYTGTWGGVPYYVIIASNSTVSNFTFDADKRLIGFDVSGTSSTIGYCRVAIQNVLLGGPYTVWVDTTPVTPTIVENGTHSFLYFNYTHSEHIIEINGTTAIPEFPSFLILRLFMIATLLAVTVFKRKKSR